MKHQMILVVHADKIEDLMKFQQDIVYATEQTSVQLRKVEIKPLES